MLSLKEKCRRLKLRGLFLWSSAICFVIAPLAAQAEDDLSGVLTSVKTDFGPTSTFIKLLYLAEILASVYAYHKTKNFAVLGGIVVLSIFLNYALGHWVFSV